MYQTLKTDVQIASEICGQNLCNRSWPITPPPPGYGTGWYGVPAAQTGAVRGQGGADEGHTEQRPHQRLHSAQRDHPTLQVIALVCYAPEGVHNRLDGSCVLRRGLIEQGQYGLGASGRNDLELVAEWGRLRCARQRVQRCARGRGNGACGVCEGGAMGPAVCEREGKWGVPCLGGAGGLQYVRERGVGGYCSTTGYQNRALIVG